PATRSRNAIAEDSLSNDMPRFLPRSSHPLSFSSGRCPTLSPRKNASWPTPGKKTTGSRSFSFRSGARVPIPLFGTCLRQVRVQTQGAIRLGIVNRNLIPVKPAGQPAHPPNPSSMAKNSYLSDRPTIAFKLLAQLPPPSLPNWIPPEKHKLG